MFSIEVSAFFAQMSFKAATMRHSVCKKIEEGAPLRITIVAGRPCADLLIGDRHREEGLSRSVGRRCEFGRRCESVD